MKRSRRLFFDFRFVPTFDAFTGPVVNAFKVDDDVVDEIGCGKSVKRNEKRQQTSWRPMDIVMATGGELTDWKGFPVIQKLRRHILDVLDELLDLRRCAHEVDLELDRLLLRPEQAVGT